MSQLVDKTSLSALEQQLLGLLRKNARLAVTDLARSLKISRSSVYAHVDRLERAGVIAGYTVMLGTDYDQRLIRAQVMIKILPKFSRATEKQLMAMPALVALHAISGEYDMIAVVESENVAALNSVIDSIGNLEGVEKTTSSILLTSKTFR
jgi:DNA-binding Lrp family transcriptional regulator